MAPDFQFKLVEYGGVLDVQSEKTDIGNQPESGPAVDGVRGWRIVVARQDDYRFLVFTKHLSGAFEQLDGLAMVVEGITGKHNYVGLNIRCCRQYLWQNG